MVMEIPQTEINSHKKRQILEIMHQVATQLLSVTEEREIYRIMSQAINQILPGAFLIITKLQPDDMNFRIMENSGFDMYFSAIEKILGKDPYLMDFPFQDLTEEEREGFDNRKINHFDNGIYDLVHGRINIMICKVIESMLSVADVYAMGFCVDKKYFGGIVFFVTEELVKSGAMNEDTKLAVENIINQSSTLIQRMRDRATLKQNEKTLLTTNLQIETLIENSSSGYLFEDVSRKILKVNKAFCNIFGITNTDMIVGFDCKDACRKYSVIFEEPENFVNEVERLLDENKALFNQELNLLNGRVLERDFIPIIDGTITGYLWQYRDITERKLTEKKLKEQTELLHELNITKDKFFTIIAHDLKGPFNSVLGLTELLLAEYDNISENERLSYINLLYNSSNTSYKLVENLLEWARLQRGQVELQREELNLAKIVNESIEPSLPNAAQKGITVTTNIENHLSLKADSNSIKTIIRNLFNNAIKYTPNGGSVVFNAHQNENDIEISIADTGIGMSPNRISKLFRIEENQSRLGTNNESGTGLGLILCKDIIAKHNGKIWAESEPGKGSVFKFSIPAI
jgi:PAS domain S-box-containing protein